MISNIFTKTEIKELEKRLQNKKENYKIWYRAKPKIEEILSIWFPHKRKLQKLLTKTTKKRYVLPPTTLKQQDKNGDLD